MSTAAKGSSTAVGVSRLSKVYPNGLRALDGVDFQMPDGAWWAVMGANGSGKSTLVKIVAGILRPSTGAVVINGDPMRAPGTVSYASEKQRLDPSLTGCGYLLHQASFAPGDQSGIPARADDLLEKLGLAGSATRRIRSFSKGMAQRLALAGALIVRPRLLIVDEPMDGLDPGNRAVMQAVLTEVWREGTTILMVSHDLPEVAELTERTVLLERGHLLDIVDSPTGMDRVRDYFVSRAAAHA